MEEKIRTFFTFPEIKEFRSAIHEVSYRARYIGRDENGDPIHDETIPLPTLKYRGTVKLHGTNAGIVYRHDGEKYVQTSQSRTSILTPKDDNMGFACYVYRLDLAKIFNTIFELRTEENPTIRIYGEWCGKGIQKGVAINKLDKMFVIFAIKIGEKWLNSDVVKTIKDPEQRIFNINDFQTFEIEIDFNDPKTAADKMGKMVEEVEKECPVGKAFMKIFNNITVSLQDNKIICEKELPKDIKDSAQNILNDLYSQGIKEPSITLLLD